MNRLMLHIEPRVARQRFAFAAENIDPLPWEWAVLLDAETVVNHGKASFKATAVLKGLLVLAWERHGLRMEERTRRKAGDNASSGDPDA